MQQHIEHTYIPAWIELRGGVSERDNDCEKSLRWLRVGEREMESIDKSCGA